MENFYNKEDYTIDDIQSLITNQVEESLQLEFKSADALNNSKKKDISKDVASFANSAGGIIIYGLKEVEHVASELTFIDGNEFTKEWLEQVISSSIQRHIPDLKIYPIRKDGDVVYTIYIVKIPYSFNAPHLSTDNRFYKRHNFMSVPMEEYEVRQTYNRKEATQLDIGDVLITEPIGSVQGQTLLVSTRHTLRFQVINIGRSIETHYKLEIHIPALILSNNNGPNSLFKYLIRRENEISVFSVPNESYLFQEERTTLISTLVEFSAQSWALASIPIKLKLYYSNGIVERELDLSVLYSYRGISIKDWKWR